MYYIANQSNQIIALDQDLMSFLDINTIEELHKQLALEEICFSEIHEEKLVLTTSVSKETYKVETSMLTGILGEMRLVQLNISDTIPQEKADDLHLIEEIIAEETEVDTEVVKKTPETDIASDDELIPIIEEPQEEVETRAPSAEKDELFELLTPETGEIEKVEVTTETDTELPDIKSTDVINIDVDKISREIGISVEDYNGFLDEYIDTAITLEKDLQSDEEEKRTNAIDTIIHLSGVLHLPAVNDLAIAIKHSDASEQKPLIETLYETLAKLTTEHLPTVDTDEPETVTEETPAVETVQRTIDLSDVKPIHFDFQIEEAAKELSLPVSLIEDFVKDFIVQAHDETEKMIRAYEQGDLETIQKIGHLLKGTSSNLRIAPLSDTLYEIQFCDDIEKVEGLVKNYWGHFLSFETQINLTSK